MNRGQRALNAEAQLEAAYAQWEQLALAEGEAIRARDWARLAACQEALQQLQPHMTETLEQVRQGWADLGLDCRSKEQQLQARGRELIALEQQNEVWLREARSTVEAQYGQSQQATRTLHRLRSTYAPMPPAAWTSYS